MAASALLATTMQNLQTARGDVERMRSPPLRLRFSSPSFDDKVLDLRALLTGEERGHQRIRSMYAIESSTYTPWSPRGGWEGAHFTTETISVTLQSK